MINLAMPDAAGPAGAAALPAGYAQYLGYVDGPESANAADLIARFPHARLVLLTVNGATLEATGIDCEPGNVNAAFTRVWVQQKLAVAPESRPVIYASVEGQPNFGMHDIVARLNGNRISRKSVRLLSAHYEWQSLDRGSSANAHICGPNSCGLIDIDMDGTQWTDRYPGIGGAFVDMSTLRADFFDQPSTETETERIVRELGIVRQGDTGQAVRTVQGLCGARGHALILIDGVFGPQTRQAVVSLQTAAGITADGVVGPQTWPVLLAVS